MSNKLTVLRRGHEARAQLRVPHFAGLVPRGDCAAQRMSRQPLQAAIHRHELIAFPGVFLLFEPAPDRRSQTIDPRLQKYAMVRQRVSAQPAMGARDGMAAQVSVFLS